MTIPNYITATDISERMTPQAYVRWFARETSGTVDTDFVAQCIADACSQWNVWVADALAGDWTANGGVVDGIVKRRLVDLAVYFAAEQNPRVAADGTSGNPFQHQYDAAEKLAKALRQGHAARLVTAAVTTPRPQGGIASVGPGGNSDDSAQSDFVREANGSLYTGF